METENTLKTIAEDYSKLIMIDIKTKLDPTSKNVDDMLSRLEEFQTMLNFGKQEHLNATEFLTELPRHKDDLKSLCNRIDSVECLLEHIKSNLQVLEDEMDKAEERLGYTDNTTTSKVANIFTPLFKKNTNIEKKNTSSTSLELFKTEDYF